jgi:hypothetical protein
MVASVFNDIFTDTLYVSEGAAIVPMFAGAAQTAVWRSKIIVDDEQPSISWARVEGDYPAVLRLYGDGVLVYTTPNITSNAPFALPAGRYREMQVEVESAARVTEVMLASSVQELAEAA